MNTIPDPIVALLRQTIRRARTVVIWRGACAVTAIGLGAFLLVMAADAVLILNTWLRYALSFPAYAVTLAAVFRFLIRPLARTFSLGGMARLIEMNHPEMQERLSSSVELLMAAGDRRAVRGSEALINALAAEAVRDARRVRPRQEVSPRAAAPYFAAAAGLTLVLASLFAALPRQTACLLARAAAPFLNLPNVHGITLSVSPGDTVLVAGGSVDVQVTLTSPRNLGVKLRQFTADGTMTRHNLSPGAAEKGRVVFRKAFDDVQAAFRYQVQAGNALSRIYSVKVLYPPRVRQVDIRYDYPPYTQLAPLLLSNSAGDIQAVAGAAVTVSAVLNQWVPSAVVEVERRLPGVAAAGNLAKPAAAGSNAPAAELLFAVTGAVSRADSNLFRSVFTWTMPPALAGDWRVKLLNQQGLPGAPFQRQIRTDPDQAPGVHILHPEQKQFQLNPTDLMPLVFAANDDYGLASVDLLLEVDGRSQSPQRLWTLAAGSTQAVKTVGRQVLLEMAQFPAARQVKLQLQATDILPSGAQAGLSDTCLITLGPKVAPFERQALESQEKSLRAALTQIHTQLVSAKVLAQPLPGVLAAEKTLPAATAKQIEQMRRNLSTAESAAHDAAERMRGGYYQSLSERLKALADTSLTRAESLTDQIKLADLPDQRGELADRVNLEINNSLTEVADMLKQFDLATAAMRDAMDLDQMAKEQKDLAQARLAMERANPTASNAPALSEKEWKASEEKIADRLAAMVRKDPGLAREVMDQARQKTADSLAEAQRLAARQADLSRALTNSADDIRRRNRELQALGDRQKRLADRAQTERMAKPAVEPMKAMGDHLKAGRLPEAIREQDRMAKSLANLARRIEDFLPNSAPSRDPLAQPPAPDRQAEAAARQAAEAARQAQAAAKSAQNAEEQAQARLKKAERLAQDTAPLRYESLAEEMNSQRDEARQAAAAVSALARQAENAANQSEQAARQARAAADQATAPGEAEPAVQQHAAAAGQNAQEARKHADQAMQAAWQARQAAAEPEAPAVRAAAAARMAAQAALDAEQAALQSQQAENQLARQVEQAHQTELAARQAGDEEQAQQAVRQADHKENLGRQAQQARQQAQQAARQAAQSAQAAQAAAEQSASTPSPRESRKQAGLAEQKAAEAAQHQAQAAQAAQQARQAASELSPQDLAQQAAQMAEQASEDARQSIEAAQQAAQQAAGNAQQAEHLARAAQQEQKPDLARTLASQAQQAEEINHHTQTALKNAERANQAAQSEAARAREAAAQAGQAPNNQAAGQKAHNAMQHAEQALNLAQQARQAARQAAAGAMQTAHNMDSARSMAQQASQLADLAKSLAQQAAEQAQQAAQEAAQAQHRANQAAAEKAAMKQDGGKEAGGEKSGGEKGGGKEAGGEKSSGEKGGGKEAGGEKGSGEKSGGKEAGGEKGSGEKSGGKEAGGEKSGGEKSGGKEAGGEKGSGKGKGKGEGQGKGQGEGQGKGQGKGQGQGQGQGGGPSQAEVASQAAQAAQQAAKQAAQAAQQAQQANKQAAKSASLPAAQQSSRQAQRSAGDAQQAAWQAQEAMLAARQAQAALQAEAIQALAEQQAALQEDTLALQDQQAREFRQLQADNLRMLQDNQKGIVQELSDTLELANETTPHLADDALRALTLARQIAEALQRGQLAAARTQAELAAGDMQQLAHKLEDAALAYSSHPMDPQTDPINDLIGAADMVDAAAARQKRMADNLHLATRDNPIAPLAIRQADLSDEVTGLEMNARLLQDHLGDLSIPVPPQAPQAASQLNQATTMAGQAAKHMRPLASAAPGAPVDPGQVNLSQQAQQTAAQALQQSSQSLDALGKALSASQPPSSGAPPSSSAPPSADAPPPASPTQGKGEGSGSGPGQAGSSESQPAGPDPNLINAYLQAAQTAAGGKGAHAVSTAQALAAAAQSAAERAQQAGANPNARGGSDPNTRWDSRPTAVGEDALRQAFGSAMRDWKNLPDELRDEILQAAETEGPEEYRLMIRQYFREMLDPQAGAL